MVVLEGLGKRGDDKEDQYLCGTVTNIALPSRRRCLNPPTTIGGEAEGQKRVGDGGGELRGPGTAIATPCHHRCDQLP